MVPVREGGDRRWLGIEVLHYAADSHEEQARNKLQRSLGLGEINKRSRE